jgi:hypothetical protein
MSHSLSKLSQFAALACVLVGLLSGLLGHPIVGAEIAVIGVIPACYGMWLGIQAETQGALVRSILLLLLALGVASLLVVAALMGWLGK